MSERSVEQVSARVAELEEQVVALRDRYVASAAMHALAESEWNTVAGAHRTSPLAFRTEEDLEPLPVPERFEPPTAGGDYRGQLAALEAKEASLHTELTRLHAEIARLDRTAEKLRDATEAHRTTRVSLVPTESGKQIVADRSSQAGVVLALARPVMLLAFRVIASPSLTMIACMCLIALAFAGGRTGRRTTPLWLELASGALSILIAVTDE